MFMMVCERAIEMTNVNYKVWWKMMNKGHATFCAHKETGLLGP